MTDPLLARAQLAIEESRKLQTQSREIRCRNVFEREALRRSVFESAMQRSEVNAHRDNASYGRSLKRDHRWIKARRVVGRDAD
jgi:hypothetical protein